MSIFLWRSTYNAELSVGVDGVFCVTTTRAYGCDDKQHCLCSEKIYLSNPSYYNGPACWSLMALTSYHLYRKGMLLVWFHSIIPVLI